ncbi:MAG: VWA domain-containing protein [Acidobacteria bacterium]|nr:VWA domain-containing protein [Acidobacteriota bacterium]
MRKFILYSFIIVALTVARGVAQDPLDQTNTIRVNTDFVSIDVAVSDRKGTSNLPRLNVEDFAVFEDGVRQKITSFAALDEPFNLALLLDTSGSTRDEIAMMQKTARRFLNLLRPQDRIAVLQFNQEVELIKDLTNDRAALEKALDELQAGSGTAFYDALQLSLDEVFRSVSGRKAVIALTDGVDSFGKTTYEKVLPQLESAGLTLYVLELNTEKFAEERYLRTCQDAGHFRFSRKQLDKYVAAFMKGGAPRWFEDSCKLEKLEKLQINQRLYEVARAELREMAEQTGGHVFPVKDLTQLDPAYAQIAEELRLRYSLAYYPSNEKHDGKWRKLRVEIKRSGLAGKLVPVIAHRVTKTQA